MRRQPRTVTAALAALLALGGIGATDAAAETDTTAEVAAVDGRLINGDGDTSGRCLEISGAGTTHRIQMGTCHVNAHAGWTFQPIGSGYFTIRSHDTTDSGGRCLTGYSQQAMMLPCDGIDDQEWSRIPAPNNWFMLKNRLHGTCLEVKGQGTSNVVGASTCGNPANAGPQKTGLLLAPTAAAGRQRTTSRAVLLHDHQHPVGQWLPERRLRARRLVIRTW